MTSRFRGDDRAIALGIVVFFGIIIIAALLYLLMNTAMVDVFSFSSDQATHSGASDQIDMAETIWRNLLFVPLLLGAIFLIVRAVREGAVGP